MEMHSSQESGSSWVDLGDETTQRDLRTTSSPVYSNKIQRQAFYTATADQQRSPTKQVREAVEYPPQEQHEGPSVPPIHFKKLPLLDDQGDGAPYHQHGSADDEHDDQGGAMRRNNSSFSEQFFTSDGFQPFSARYKNTPRTPASHVAAMLQQQASQKPTSSTAASPRPPVAPRQQGSSGSSSAPKSSEVQTPVSTTLPSTVSFGDGVSGMGPRNDTYGQLDFEGMSHFSPRPPPKSARGVAAPPPQSQEQSTAASASVKSNDEGAKHHNDDSPPRLLINTPPPPPMWVPPIHLGAPSTTIDAPPSVAADPVQPAVDESELILAGLRPADRLKYVLTWQDVRCTCKYFSFALLALAVPQFLHRAVVGTETSVVASAALLFSCALGAQGAALHPKIAKPLVKQLQERKAKKDLQHKHDDDQRDNRGGSSTTTCPPPADVETMSNEELKNMIRREFKLVSLRRRALSLVEGDNLTEFVQALTSPVIDHVIDPLLSTVSHQQHQVDPTLSEPTSPAGEQERGSNAESTSSSSKTSSSTTRSGFSISAMTWAVGLIFFVELLAVPAFSWIATPLELAHCLVIGCFIFEPLRIAVFPKIYSSTASASAAALLGGSSPGNTSGSFASPSLKAVDDQLSTSSSVGAFTPNESEPAHQHNAGGGRGKDDPWEGVLEKARDTRLKLRHAGKATLKAVLLLRKSLAKKKTSDEASGDNSPRRIDTPRRGGSETLNDKEGSPSTPTVSMSPRRRQQQLEQREIKLIAYDTADDHIVWSRNTTIVLFTIMASSALHLVLGKPLSSMVAGVALMAVDRFVPLAPGTALEDIDALGSTEKKN